MPVRARSRLVGVPTGSVIVPGATYVEATPVIVSNEADRWNANGSDADIGQRAIFATIIEGQIFADDPASAATPDHVAPRFVIKASLDFNQRAFRDEIDPRKIYVRSGSHIDVSGGVAGCRLGGGRSQNRGADNNANQFQFFHQSPRCSWVPVEATQLRAAMASRMHNGLNAPNPTQVRLQNGKFCGGNGHLRPLGFCGAQFSFCGANLSATPLMQ
jgi:hypothetical protein